MSSSLIPGTRFLRMIYKGYKIRVSCIAWEQVELLDRYWNLCKQFVAADKLVGLGMNWSDNHFDYALGAIDDDDTLAALKQIDFSKTEFDAEYIEIELPEPSEWKVFKGKEDDLKQIYEQEIDCYNKPYDYELEYISDGNLEIKIHYL